MTTKQKETQLYEKKGNIDSTVGAVITLIVGVGVSILVLIFVGTLGGQAYTLTEPKIETLAGDVVNETFTPNNLTGVTLTNDNIVNASIKIVNGSNTVSLKNFDLSAANLRAGRMNLSLDHAHFNSSTLNITYSHGDADVENAIKHSIRSGFSGLEQTGDYLPIIVLAVIISLVLFLVLGMGMGYGGGSNKGGMNSAL